MKTDDLITMLATGAAPVPRRVPTRRLLLAVAFGLPLAIAIVGTQYGFRRDLIEAMFWPMLWLKFLFPLCMAWAGFVVVQRLARPGARVGPAWWALAAPVLVVWAMAAVALLRAPQDDWPQMLFGQTWRTCVFSIAFISLPTFIAALVALKGLAPTRPGVAGAAAGAMAAGVGAAIYALHCPELAAPFLAIWYVGGIALMAGAGALIGRALLRWYRAPAAARVSAGRPAWRAPPWHAAPVGARAPLRGARHRPPGRPP